MSLGLGPNPLALSSSRRSSPLLSADDHDRPCRVACQDEAVPHRFYLVNGRDGWFPFGTDCARGRPVRAFCISGRCLVRNHSLVLRGKWTHSWQANLSNPLLSSRSSARTARPCTSPWPRCRCPPGTGDDDGSGADDVPWRPQPWTCGCRSLSQPEARPAGIVAQVHAAVPRAQCYAVPSSHRPLSLGKGGALRIVLGAKSHNRFQNAAGKWGNILMQCRHSMR